MTFELAIINRANVYASEPDYLRAVAENNTTQTDHDDAVMAGLLPQIRAAGVTDDLTVRTDTLMAIKAIMTAQVDYDAAYLVDIDAWLAHHEIDLQTWTEYRDSLVADMAIYQAAADWTQTVADGELTWPL